MTTVTNVTFVVNTTPLTLKMHEDMWLQYNEAPPNSALNVQDILNKNFLGHWTGSGLQAYPTPLSWPPCSPDLTKLDNSFVVHYHRQVAAQCYDNNELHRAVEQAFTTIKSHFCVRCGINGSIKKIWANQMHNI